MAEHAGGAGWTDGPGADGGDARAGAHLTRTAVLAVVALIASWLLALTAQQSHAAGPNPPARPALHAAASVG
ncbi:hypothetical protein [Streptomyces sp. TRM68367]|uniref:hypothetical protein n=1 Tax=Streptomyces sp. TRM68367 TaxID=2758415 RepID=UPI00165A205E|nr:hypothetical protein [Streptomyces sp. TRM68367]MBC9731331.1 hypothetical protein [Streptomyces sp. TRM68367]